MSAVIYCILQSAEVSGAPTQLLLPSCDGLPTLDEQQSIHEEAVQTAQVRHTTSSNSVVLRVNLYWGTRSQIFNRKQFGKVYVTTSRSSAIASFLASVYCFAGGDFPSTSFSTLGKTLTKFSKSCLLKDEFVHSSKKLYR